MCIRDRVHAIRRGNPPDCGTVRPGNRNPCQRDGSCVCGAECGQPDTDCGADGSEIREAVEYMGKSKLVYIASPYAGDVETNVQFAKAACRYAIGQGATPVAPHLLYTQILADRCV